MIISPFESFHDPEIASILIRELKRFPTGKRITLMHVCGTHEHSLAKAGIRSLLPGWIRLVAGPGCPVCVCPAGDIDLAMQAASKEKVILATFGDMFRVPSGDRSLEMMKAEGADIRVIYSPLDPVKIAIDNPDREVVFMAVGFETTIAPIAASILSGLPRNYSMITSLRVVPEALIFLLDRTEGGIDGFILPGHVSTVLGRKGYSFLETEYSVPGVISGFEPVDILHGILELARQVSAGPPYTIENLYRRVVREDGNTRASRMIYEVFQKADSRWRGIGTIPGSGLELKKEYASIDAVQRHRLQYDENSIDVPEGCICHKVILGEAESEDCPLFGSRCTPRSPVGPCMVSSEGTCRARYQYRTVPT
ncbi:MAG: hydrogenase formation protein HypD [Candidatus Krumholzibacteriota bacterium]|nr:hydrogenase formation protein HypD [Candidatus Krumholzibacteriota bacterium]